MRSLHWNRCRMEGMSGWAKLRKGCVEDWMEIDNWNKEMKCTCCGCELWGGGEEHGNKQVHREILRMSARIQSGTIRPFIKRHNSEDNLCWELHGGEAMAMIDYGETYYPDYPSMAWCGSLPGLKIVTKHCLKLLQSRTPSLISPHISDEVGGAAEPRFPLDIHL